jgi:uncharacterized protein (TIGR02678 family)
VIRLRKTSGDWADDTRPATLSSGVRPEFSRRRYVLLCLALGVLERSESQVTLGRMVDQVVALAADPALAEAGITFTLTDRNERADLAAVARLLMELGVLTRVAGDEQAFVSATGDVLYDVNREVMSTLLVARRGPSLIPPRSAVTPASRITALTAEPVHDTDEARNRAVRHRLARRLLDDPVVYYDDLDESERAYLTLQRGPLLRRLTEATGLVAESRAEGIALIDPIGEATDLGMPEEGTEGHVTLLVAELLASTLESNGRPLTLDAVHAHVRQMADRYRSYWRKSTQEPGAERELTALALRRLYRLGLIGPPPEITPFPALARFSYAPHRVVGRPEKEHS